MIPEAGSLSGRDRKTRKGHKQAVRQHHLEQLLFMDVIGVISRIVDIRTQTRRRKRNLRVGIFLLNQRSVNSYGKSVFSEIVQS